MKQYNLAENPGQIEDDAAYIPMLLQDIKDPQLKTRLEHTLYTYARRALFYKRMYYFLTICAIILPGMVPVINVVSGEPLTIPKLLSSIVSTLASICTACLGAANVRDNWLSYRSNCELLKEETFKYVTATGNYQDLEDKDREEKFVDIMCKLYHEEAISWKRNNNVTMKRS